MEPPDHSLYWEKYSISVDTETDVPLSSIYLLISEASLHPLQNTVTEKEENVESYNSFKHQLDLELRKAVNGIALSLRIIDY